MTEEQDERFEPYAPLGTSVSHPQAVERKQRAHHARFSQIAQEIQHLQFHHYLMLLLNNHKLAFNEAAVTAAGDTILEWQATQECYITQIITNGTAADAVKITLNGDVFAVLRHAANGNANLNMGGSRPYLLRMRAGDIIKITSELAAAGTHNSSILGFLHEVKLDHLVETAKQHARLHAPD
jgi:hypothetical protein